MVGVTTGVVNADWHLDTLSLIVMKRSANIATSSVVPCLVKKVPEVEKRSITNASPTTEADKNNFETAPTLASSTPMKRVKKKPIEPTPLKALLKLHLHSCHLLQCQK